MWVASARRLRCRPVPDSREVVILAGSLEIARSRRALRLLEAASPPATPWRTWSGATRSRSRSRSRSRIRSLAGFMRVWITPDGVGPFKGAAGSGGWQGAG